MYIKIVNWPFKSIQNTLDLVFEAQDSANSIQNCNIDAQTDYSNSLQSFVISVGNSSLYPCFLFIFLSLSFVFFYLYFFIFFIFCLFKTTVTFCRYGQFIAQSIVDGKNRVLSFSLNDDGTVTASVPHFWTQFGILLLLFLF